MQITITQKQFPTTRATGSTATVRIYSSKAWLTYDGDLIQQIKGRRPDVVQGDRLHRCGRCSHHSGLRYRLDSRRHAGDGQVHDGRLRCERHALVDDGLLKHFYVPDDLGTTITFAQLVAVNIDSAPNIPGETFTQSQTLALVANSIAGFAKATELTYGMVRFPTLTPALVTSDPIVVPDNDARVNTLNVAQYANFPAAVDAAIDETASNGFPTVLEISKFTSTATKTVPSTVILKFKNGGYLRATGALVIQGEIRAGAQKILATAGGGTIDISAAIISEAYFEWFGNTSEADNAVTMQKLITARKGVNTTIRLLRGVVYSFGSMLNLDSCYNMHLEGDGGYSDGPEMRFTGSGSGIAIRARSAIGFTATGITFTYSNTAFTGTLFKFGHDPALAADAPAIFTKCRFQGTAGAHLANTLLDLDLCIIVAIRDCVFTGSLYGIRGGSTDYCNQVLIENNTFVDLGIAIIDPSQSWTIRANTFEPTQNTRGSFLAGELRAIGVVSGAVAAYNIVIEGNWVGDVIATSGHYSIIKVNGGYGVNINGNFILYGGQIAGSGGATTAIELSGCIGANITGNYASCDNFLGASGSSSSYVHVAGNQVVCTNFGPIDLTSGGFFFSNVTYLSNSGGINQIGIKLQVNGSSSEATVGSFYGVTIGALGANAPDNGLGSAVRSTEGVPGYNDGDLILQPNTSAARGIIFRLFNGSSVIRAIEFLASGIKFATHLIFGTDNTWTSHQSFDKLSTFGECPAIRNFPPRRYSTPGTGYCRSTISTWI
jgi:hypothetical protein